MKISLILAALILIAGIFFGIHRHQELQILTEKLATLEVEAGKLNIPTDPTLSFDSDRIRSESSRETRRHTVTTLAQEIIAFYQNSESSPPENLGERISKLGPDELRLLLQIIADDPSLDGSQKIVGSWSPLRRLSEIDAQAALTNAVDLMTALGNDAPENDMIQSLFVRYSRSDPFAAAQWYLVNKERVGMIENWVRELLIEKAAGTDPTAAIALVKPLDPTDEEASFRAIGRQVNTENIYQFLEALRDKDQKYGQSKTALRAIAQSPVMKDFETATTFLKSPELTPGERNVITASLDYENLKGHTPEWLDWLESNEKNEELQIYVTQEIVEQWAQDDFASAGEWLNQQHEGARKTQATQSYAEALAPHEPTAAADWAATLPEGNERSRIFAKIHRSLAKKDPAAGAAFAERHGIPTGD